MKLIKNLLRVVTAALCGAFVLASCSNIVDKPVKTEGAYLKGTAASRSALLPSYDLEDFNKYTLTGVYPDDNTTEWDEDGNAHTVEYPVDLGEWESYTAFVTAYIAIPKTGTWNFVLEASTANGTVFNSSVNGVLINNGANTVNFPLSAKEYAIESTAKGGFEAAIKIANAAYDVEVTYDSENDTYEYDKSLPQYTVSAIVKKGENLAEAVAKDSKALSLVLQPSYGYDSNGELYELSDAELYGTIAGTFTQTGDFIATVEETDLESGIYWVVFSVNKGSFESIVTKTVMIVVADGKITTQETGADAAETVTYSDVSTAEGRTLYNIYYANDDKPGVAYTAEYSKPLTFNSKDTDATVLPTADDISRYGYTFGGWYTTSTFEEGTEITEIAAGTEYDVSVYLKWDLIEYTIEYNINQDNDGKMPANYITTYSVESVRDLPSPTPVTDGYEFKGWYTTSDFQEGTKVATYAADNIALGDLILYAKFGLISYYISYYNVTDAEGYDYVTMPNFTSYNQKLWIG